MRERYAGTAQPRRFERKPAKTLKKMKVKKTAPDPRTAYALGTCVCCSRRLRAGYLESCSGKAGAGADGAKEGTAGHQLAIYPTRTPRETTRAYLLVDLSIRREGVGEKEAK